MIDRWIIENILRQIHFGSQCATERVYRYLIAKVELKKSHFGKQSFIECALRYPPCQSELASKKQRHAPVNNSDVKSPETRHKVNYLRRIVPHKKSSQVTAFFYISKKLIFQVRPMLMMVWRSWVMYWVPPL